MSSLLWSSDHRELITGHGFSHYQLTLWKYPAMTKVSDLHGHTVSVESDMHVAVKLVAPSPAQRHIYVVNRYMYRSSFELCN